MVFIDFGFSSVLRDRFRKGAKLTPVKSWKCVLDLQQASKMSVKKLGISGKEVKEWGWSVWDKININEGAGTV